MPNLARLLILCAILFALVGCGGGGGPAPAVLRYTTDWTNRGRAGEVTGVSQRVSVFDMNGVLVASQIINFGANSRDTVQFTDVENRPYRLLIELYSQFNLGGTQTGVVDARVTVGGTTSFETGVGETATSLRVSPDVAAFRVQGSQQFFAYALAGTRATFVGPGTITWTTLGGVADINQEGIATGTTAGSGSVRATHAPTGLLGSAAITVSPLNVTTSKWTVLVYLNAANDLSFFDEANVNQMERVASNPDVRFVLQWKQARGSWDSNPTFQGTRRYLVKPDQGTGIASELISDMGQNVDMGRSQTLLDFLNWGRTFYPADRYVVIIWNHGNGWRRSRQAEAPTRGVSYDDETGNSIQTWQLNSALGPYVWDIVAWDASLMQMLEVAYEIKDRAQFVVGSEESPPGEGYPYDLIFSRFRDNPNQTTRELTKAFVDGMNDYAPYATRKITQSSLDTTKLGALATAVNQLGNALITNKDNAVIRDHIPVVRTQAQTYSQATGRTYRDLIDVCLKLEANVNLPGDVFLASQAVRVAANDAIVYERSNSNSLNSTGISIDFSTSASFLNLSTDYARLRFGLDTSWDEWLKVAP